MTDELELLASALEGRYSVEELLGEGSMARVFLGTDLKHGRPVAIKILRSESADDDLRARFEREIASVAKLRHPHVLPLIDSGEFDGRRYLITPYIEGETLRKRLLREGELPLEDALWIARDVAEALASAHEHGLVHRDIKPSNILLSGGHAIVADFGVVRYIDGKGAQGLSSVGLRIGTPVYMSPEQATGESTIDGRSDIYSLACVVYEMLAGQPPFMDTSVSAVIAKHVLEPPPDLRKARPDLPKHLREAVRKALSKDPGDRHPDAMGFLRHLVGEDARASSSGRLSGTSWRWQRAPALRRRAPWVAAALATATVAIVALRASLTGPSVEPGPRAVLVLGYESPEATDEERARLRRSEDELTRLLAGWDQVGSVPSASKSALRVAEGIEAGTPLSLDRALSLARRADATLLVQLEQTITEDSTYAQARLYDVPSGDRTGTPVSSAAAAADVYGLVAPVALQVLGFDRRIDDLGAVLRETSDVEAVQLQLAGQSELEQLRLESAEDLLSEAVARDSLFARAHYLLGLTLYWQGASNTASFSELGGAIRRHASAARRNSGSLNARDSVAVEAFFEFHSGRYQAARERYEQLIDSDSTDVYAWLLLGAVEYEDPAAIEGADGVLKPRGSWNRASSTFSRTVRLAPDFYLGFGQLFEVYQRISSAAERGLCFGFEAPGDESSLAWEERAAVTRLCPIVRDSIEFVNETEFDAMSDRELLAGAERFLDAALLELERWADYATGSEWPQRTLVTWMLARAEMQVAAGSRRSWSELVADALPYAERALTLTSDTVPADLVLLGNLRLALGDYAGAVELAEGAVDLARSRAGAEIDLPSGAANPLSSSGRASQAVGAAVARTVGLNMTIQASDGSPLEVLALPTVTRLSVYGATGLRGERLSAAFDSLETAWVDAGYTETQRLDIRQAITDRLEHALALDPSQLRRWFDGWTPEDPLLHGILLRDRDPERAHALLTEELGSWTDGIQRRGGAFLAGSLAQRLGDHERAVWALEMVERAPASLATFDEGWGLGTLSHLLLGRSYEALGDASSALAHYGLFVDAWAEPDPELTSLRREAEEAIARLRALQGRPG